MKYAVVGPMGAINRVSDTEPQHVSEQAAVVEISDEQAATVVAGRAATPRVLHFWHEGELETQAERHARLNPPSLRERLLAITNTQSAQVKAAFAPVLAGVDWLIQQGDIAAAKVAVDNVQVPEELAPVKAALYAEFD